MRTQAAQVREDVIGGGGEGRDIGRGEARGFARQVERSRRGGGKGEGGRVCEEEADEEIEKEKMKYGGGGLQLTACSRQWGEGGGRKEGCLVGAGEGRRGELWLALFKCCCCCCCCCRSPNALPCACHLARVIVMPRHL